MTCRAARQAGVQWSVLPRRVGWERGLSGLKTGPWLAEKELMRLGLRERLLPALVFGLTVAALPAAVVLVLGHITVRLTGGVNSDHVEVHVRGEAHRPGWDRLRRDGEPARASWFRHARCPHRPERRRRIHRRRDASRGRCDPRPLGFPA